MTVTVQKVGGVLRKAGFQRAPSARLSGYRVFKDYRSPAVYVKHNILWSAEQAAEREEMLGKYKAALEAAGLCVTLKGVRLIVTSPEEGEAS